jgi:hypothetical protein
VANRSTVPLIVAIGCAPPLRMARTTLSGPSSFSGGLHPTRNPAVRRSNGGVAGGARKGSFEAGEQVDDIGCLEDSVALPPDVALAQHSGGFETVDGFACSHLGSSDQSCGAVDGDHRDAWQ